MKRAALYVRVSTLRQASEGISIEQQREQLKEFAQQRGFDVAEVLSDEGLSGGTTKRPGFQRVLELVRTKAIDAVIVYEISRLTRELRAMLEAVELMQRRGVEFLSLTDNVDAKTAAGRAHLNMLGTFVQFQREAIAERTAAALQFKRGRRERVGQIPFGFALASDGVHLEPNETEMRALGLIRRLRASGLTYRRIAQELERRGIQNKAGAIRWDHKQVMRLERRAA